MLRVGLTGGIGAGKSTVAARLAEHGAVVIDSDKIAREVVAAGSDGLAEVVAAFGPGVLTPDGELDRPAVARIVFEDEQARTRLNGIVHPRVRRRSAELVAGAAADAVTVHDIPLLVETGLASAFHLVLVVHAPAQIRVRRLVERGLSETDARARIASQASDEQRRAAADVWLDNSGWPDEVLAAVDALWAERLVPFEANVRLRRTVHWQPRLVPADPTWPEQARRVCDRVALAAGGRRVDHIGSTAVPGLPAKDVLDLQLTVASLDEADSLADAIADAGYPRRPDIDADMPKPSDPDPARWRKRLHQAADPGRLVNLHVRVAGSPGWRYALLFRDWLLADPDSRAEYLGIKEAAAAAHPEDRYAYAEAKEPWFEAGLARAEEWASRTGWTPVSGAARTA
ncbi:MAG TPA: dephospho-CoA kinase [Actinomycetes bacterium]|nr:dephospho-CoA kinase [Actinomycetes bacterium]